MILFTDDMIRQIETLAGYGLSQDKIASVLGVHPTTMDRRKRDNAKVKEAIMRGRSMMEGACARALCDRVKEGDIPAIKWYEMTRCGRSEKQEVKEESEVTVRVVPHQD